MSDQTAPPTGTRTACSYCGVGCGIVVETRADGRGLPIIAKVRGDKEHPVNAGRLCTKGNTHAELMAAPGRMETAYRRPERGLGTLIPMPVDEAIHEAAERLRVILDTYGPDAIALYVSGQMSLEAQYLATKLAKGHLRTVHMEANSRLCMASAASGYKLSLGADGPPGSYDDLDHADLFFVIGANMADCHPILFLRMADRLKAGAKLIVVDPRRTDTAARADLFLQIKPGTDLALLNGLLHLLVENGDIDAEFIAEHTEGWEGMPEFLAGYTPALVAEVTGLAEADIRTAAAWIGAAGEWMSLWTMGINQSTHGTWATNAIINLHLATGAICRTGSGPFSLTGQPNAMGGREMGYMGPGLPGQRSLLSAADRAFAEEVWELEPGAIRDEAGPGSIEMFRGLADGRIKAAWIMCSNPVASMANRRTVIAGLEAAELVIAQDVYTDTATNAYADLLLPATLWAEADGVQVNSERTLTLLRKSVEPIGDARPDWQLIAQVATALGFPGFEYASSAEIFDEIQRFANPATGYDLRGIDYATLAEGPAQWPCPDPARRRNPIRYLNDGVSQTPFTDEHGRTPRLAFATPSRKAVFFPRPHLLPDEMPDDDHPFVLNTGRLQHQWHTMTKTGRVAKLNKLNGTPFVEVHPDDAAKLDVREGDQLEIASRRGRAVLPVRISDRVLPGTCFAPFHWNDEQGEYLTINAVTNDAVDPISLQPEFKACAVRLRKVAALGPTSPNAVGGEGVSNAAAGSGATPPASADSMMVGGPPDRRSHRPADDQTGSANSAAAEGGSNQPEGSRTGSDRSAPGDSAYLGRAGADATGFGVFPSMAESAEGAGPSVGGSAAVGDGVGHRPDPGSSDGASGFSPTLDARRSGPHPLAVMLGLEGASAPTLDEVERIYLGGYFAALRSVPVSGVPVLPETAPISERGRLWVDGLLGGMYSRAAQPDSSALGDVASAFPAPGTSGADGSDTTARIVTVLWASQTGTAEELAASLVGYLADSGFVPRLLDMDSAELSDLTGDVLVISSTFGDGGPPDNGTDFWERLNDSATRLTGLRYAVFALGDSSYDDFCGHGRKLDELFAQRGATRLLPRVDSEPDHDDLSAAWFDEVLTTLAAALDRAPDAPGFDDASDIPWPPGGFGDTTPIGPGGWSREVADDVPTGPPTTGAPVFGPHVHPSAWNLATPGTNSKGTGIAEPHGGNASPRRPGLGVGPVERVGAVATPGLTRGRSHTATAAPFTRNSPFLAKLVRNEPLSSDSSGKEVRQFGFDLSDLDATYEVGDSLGIRPANCEALVAEWLATTGLEGHRIIDVDDSELTLAEALRTRYDITRVSADLLSFVAERNASPRLAKLLRRDNRNELDGYLWDRQAVDVLRDFPVRADLVEWLGTLKKLQPRQYSISSSPLVSPREVQLTVGVVRYGDPAGIGSAARRGGVCSTFLADRAEAEVPIFLQRAPHFRPPLDPTAPMIMVGPGTGIAPFRGFLQERRALGCTGRNWLFFGDQHAKDNFYYRAELEDMFRSGFLTRLDLAFSRDQRERIYVQHRMIEHGAELWAWLREGGHFYVCGDAARMAKDVDDTLLRIARIHGKLSEDGALAFKKQLVAEKRYVRDVY
ncbi:molybdopterin-dependent oxidoreductase [Nocardia sp. ET3-3]|uniref:assimilatory sulfite reductase (NADPH) n=1 Tax=Nocardia terrae TaxID=2675851 RepID=A0A7K1VAK8_9NOCA|nr:bifunctional nitrate reductase/sulfite reductase flavoprotein subunit alpha [Nocardia terrae]MVU83684.1 molybdopterin-dependent oxidoreductase [Nocardia terrae]